MTEAEWLACTDLGMLLGTPGHRENPIVKQAGRRKLRLFACACLRRVWPLMIDLESRQAVEIAEKYADGLTNRKQLMDAHDAAWRVWQGFVRSENSGIGGHAAIFDAGRSAIEAADTAASLAGRARIPHFKSARAAEQVEQCKLLRDIFGNPFRPVTISPAVLAWSDGLVVRLAQAAYEERHLPAGTLDNGRLAVLADALEETGCDNADILAHCRQPGSHVRGCWVVDLLLGKS